MVKKIIRLTEADLTRLVKRVINEQRDVYPRYKWGQYSLEGDFIRSYDTPSQAARILNCPKNRYIYHAAAWHEGNGQFAQQHCGYMWKKVRLDQDLPLKITSIWELE